MLRSPSKLLRLFGGNLLTQVLFAIAFAVSAQAFGVHLPLSEFLLINTVVSLFAGLIPVPGGIGVTEAGPHVRPHRRRRALGDRLRHRPRLPLHELLPAPDLGMVLLPLAGAAPSSAESVSSPATASATRDRWPVFT